MNGNAGNINGRFLLRGYIGDFKSPTALVCFDINHVVEQLTKLRLFDTYELIDIRTLPNKRLVCGNRPFLVQYISLNKTELT